MQKVSGKKLTTGLFSVVFLLMGAMCLLDALGVAFFGIKNVWFGMLLGMFAVAIAIVFFVTKKNYLCVAVWLAALSVLLILTGVGTLEFARLWPVLPLGLFLGIFVDTVFSSRKGTFKFLFVTYGVIISVLALISTLISDWRYTLPAILLFTGVLLAVVTFSNKKASDVSVDIPAQSITKRKEEILNEAKKDNN